ncbi:hypothetical protein HYZ99_02220 [Candidatus Peregrinibacteria bacterium]|nr:hypothetical protein [Candidatus Peregrinibacteria bacterium]
MLELLCDVPRNENLALLEQELGHTVGIVEISQDRLRIMITGILRPSELERINQIIAERFAFAAYCLIRRQAG